MDHFIADIFYFFCWIAGDQTSFFKPFTSFYKTEGTYNTLVFQHYIVHYNTVHTYKAILANNSAVNNSAVANMGRLFQPYRYAREHMNGTIFLHIATVFNNDLSPVATDGRSRS